MRAATALHPHGQILKAAVVQAQGAITTPGTPAASPFWGRGGAGGPAQPPQDTHTHIPAVLPFGVTAAGEFQLFRHLYLFWLPLLLRPRYKLKAASLPAPSEPHLFTSSLPMQAEGGLLQALKGCHRAPPLSPCRGVPTKAPCSRSLSPLMDGVAGASAGLRPPGWHRHVAKLGDNPGVLIHKGKAPPARSRGSVGTQVSRSHAQPRGGGDPMGCARGGVMTDRQLGWLSSGK